MQKITNILPNRNTKFCENKWPLPMRKRIKSVKAESVARLHPRHSHATFILFTMYYENLKDSKMCSGSFALTENLFYNTHNVYINIGCRVDVRWLNWEKEREREWEETVSVIVTQQYALAIDSWRNLVSGSVPIHIRGITWNGIVNISRLLIKQVRRVNRKLNQMRCWYFLSNHNAIRLNLIYQLYLYEFLKQNIQFEQFYDILITFYFNGILMGTRNQSDMQPPPTYSRVHE